MHHVSGEVNLAAFLTPRFGGTARVGTGGRMHASERVGGDSTGR